MIETPMDVLREFPIRKSGKQKQAFRDAVGSYARNLGYKVSIEKGNVVIGDPETAAYLITSVCGSDSGVVTLLETLASMPANLRDRVCHVVFDGSRGSVSHREKHRCASDLQTVLHLRRTANGDTITITPSKALKSDEMKLNRLIDLERRCGPKRVRVRDRAKRCLSRFPVAVIVSARKGRFPNLRDSVADYTNVNILRACLISYIGGASE